MFSPDLMRHIIDPENIVEDVRENTEIPLKNQVFYYGMHSHERVLSDYNFFFRFMYKMGEIYNFLLSSKHLKKCEIKESSGLQSL